MSSSLRSVFHLEGDLSIVASDFWSEADKGEIYMIQTAPLGLAQIRQQHKIAAVLQASR